MKRAWRSVVVAAFVVLTSCAGPADETLPPPVGPWIVAEVQVDADGDARVAAWGEGVGAPGLSTVASRVVAEVFPAASAGEVSPVDGVAPLVSVAVDVEDALAGALVVSVPGSRIEPAMRAAGAESVRLSVCLPVVPVDLAANPPTDVTDAGSCEVFVPDAFEPLPDVEFTLHPEPWRWIVGLLLVVASLILAIVGLVRRLRAAAVGSLGLLAVAAATGLGSQFDATLAGLSSSSVVAVASSLARWTGLAAASVAVVALGRLRPVKTAPDEPTRPAVPVH